MSDYSEYILTDREVEDMVRESAVRQYNLTGDVDQLAEDAFFPGTEDMEVDDSQGIEKEVNVVKLEKSRQSARECRARKKLRYQYLDDMIEEREKANLLLREELNKYVVWCQQLDSNQVPAGLKEFLSSDRYQGSS